MTDDRALFINRELSWLEFNARVLDQARDSRVPLLERMKFLAIFGSNLDEFFMIRVSGLHEQLQSRVGSTAPDGLSVVDQLARIRERVLALTASATKLLREELAVELERAGIRVLGWKQLSRSQREWARDHFRKAVFPVLTPLAVDPAHPFPFLSNLSLSLAVDAAADRRCVPDKKRHVVECLVRDRRRNAFRLRPIGPDHDDAGMVVLHRQATIVFRLLHLAWRQPARPGKRRAATGVEKHGRLVVFQDVAKPILLDLLQAAQCSPDRHAELVASHLGKARGEQVLGESLGSAAEGAIAIEDDTRGPVAPHGALHLAHIRHILRCRHARLALDVQRARNVTERELARGPGIEHDRRLRLEDRSQLGSGDLGRFLSRLAQGRLQNGRRPAGRDRTAGVGHEEHDREQRKQAVHECLPFHGDEATAPKGSRAARSRTTAATNWVAGPAARSPSDPS